MAWLARRLHAVERQLLQKRGERWAWLGFRARPEDDRGAMLQDVQSLLRELPEEGTPETVEVSVCVPTLDITLRDDPVPGNEGDFTGSIRGDLEANARGLDIRLRAKATDSQWQEAELWAELISAKVGFAGAPLFKLENVMDTGAPDEDGFEDLPGAAVQITTACTRQANYWYCYDL